MHNIFITQGFDWKQPPPSRRVQFVNGVLEMLGFTARLSAPAFTGLMTNVEQRMNMYHLASQVLAYGIPGDFVELGCNTGQSAVLFKKIMERHDNSRQLHVYDSFEGLPGIKPEDGKTSFRPG